MKTIIQIDNVTKKYGANIVLNQASLSVFENDLLYLKGINGSGKSTLLKIICGIVSPNAGTVEVMDGLRIGALIENPGFIENETLYENMKFLGDLTKSFDEALNTKLAEALQLDFHSKVKMGKYSVGMRQKAGIMQAVNENQQCILFDEPTRGLDEESEKAFLELCVRLHEEGKTIVVVSHDKPSLPFNRAMELKQGRLVEAGN